MAVFVTEDDPQDGQDHLDAHRTIQLVVSPYVKRGYVSAVTHSNMSTLKTMDLLLGVPPNSTQEASATPLSDYFTATPQLDPRYVAKAQQVPLKLNPSAASASNAQLAAAARLQEQVPAGLDEGGSMLQAVLRARHAGAQAAGEPGVPVLANEVEHRLDTSSPKPLALSANPGGACPLTSVAAARGSGLPPTGRNARLLIPAALCLAFALSRNVSRRARRRGRTPTRR
jgi:hypothetical protein